MPHVNSTVGKLFGGAIEWMEGWGGGGGGGGGKGEGQACTWLIRCWAVNRWKDLSKLCHNCRPETGLGNGG